MPDFLAALGLLFAVEGIFLAAFPAGAKRAHKLSSIVMKGCCVATPAIENAPNAKTFAPRAVS